MKNTFCKVIDVKNVLQHCSITTLNMTCHVFVTVIAKVHYRYKPFADWLNFSGTIQAMHLLEKVEPTASGSGFFFFLIFFGQKLTFLTVELP